MSAYYNENDPYAAQWLRNLIAAGHIAAGDVDERSIVDVKPDEVRRYRQCHFFAGIGGWSYALRLAGWPDDRAVWTGSCPCQPFSAAGKRKGFEDDRHLWPIWRELIRERCPPVVFGEQVARATGWLQLVRSDLEAMGYAVGAVPIEAASVGANHRRDRLWFFADATGERQQATDFASGGGGSSMADADGCGWAKGNRNISSAGYGNSAPSGCDDGNPDRQSLAVGEGERSNTRAQQQAVVGAGWWSTEPDVGRVANGVPDRVGKLRALGNAIVPQVAAEFIRAACG